MQKPGRTGRSAGVVRMLHRAEVGAVPVAGGLASPFAGAQPRGDGAVAVRVADRRDRPDRVEVHLSQWFIGCWPVQTRIPCVALAVKNPYGMVVCWSHSSVP